jgi:hypothetical protein
VTKATPTLNANAARLLEVLQSRAGELAERIVERVTPFYEADPAAGPIPQSELRFTAEAMVRLAITALQEQRGPSDAELAQASNLGQQRARQGVSLETLLRGVRVSAREALASVRELSDEVGLDVPTTVELATALWDWIDEVSVEVADAHRHVELALARRDQQRRVSLLHGLVHGTIAPHRIDESAAAFDLDPAADHLVLRARPSVEHPAEELERLLLPSTWSTGLAAVIGDDLVAILARPPAVELPAAAGLGPAVQLAALPRSYRHAGRALETALRFGLSGSHTLEDLGLRAAVLADDALGQILVERYVAPVQALGAFGEELLHSLRVYAEQDQNMDAAAHSLFVHPNTLRHRLTRFEEVTGANLRNVEQLAGVWWAITLAGAGSPPTVDSPS